jgi:CBS domain-containing protein
MTAFELRTDHNYYTIESDRTVQEALEIIERLQLRQVIVVKADAFYSLVNEEKLLELDRTRKIIDCDIVNQEAFALSDTHIFELFKKMVKGRLSVMPVLDQGEMVGAVLFTTVSDALLDYCNFEGNGSVLIVETLKGDYSLASICRIIETEGFQVLMATSKVMEDTNSILITLKINNIVNNSLVNSLERYGYQVLAKYAEMGYEAVWKDRYEALMNYLNV